MAFLGGPSHPRLKGSLVCTNVTLQSMSIGSANDPFTRSYPVFMGQFVSITLAFLVLRLILKRLRQPRFVCSAMAGIVVYAVVRRNTKYIATQPKEEILLARTFGALGTTYLLFLTAVKADITVIQRTMRKASIIGSLSVFVPFALTILVVHKLSLPVMENSVNLYSFTVGLSLTRFPNIVLAFNELSIMTSDLGQLAVSCSMISETIVWVFMFNDSFLIAPRYLLYSILSTAAVLLLIFGIVRPVIRSIVQKLPESKPVSEIYISSILIMALVMAFLTDMIGSVNLGVLMFGLVIPNGPPLGVTLSEKIELITMEIMMPMFYVVVGFNTDVRVVDLKFSREILLVILISASLKMGVVLVAALCCKLGLQHSILLGLMLNIKGPYDAYLLNRWLQQVGSYIFL